MDATAKEGIKNYNSYHIFQEVGVSSTFPHVSSGEITLKGFYSFKRKKLLL